MPANARPIHLAIGFALLLAASPAVANDSGNAAQSRAAREPRANLFQNQPKVPNSPYSGLFEPPDLRTTARSLEAPRPDAGQPRVVCGMTLIPMDPSIDPKIYVGPWHSDTRYTIRSVTPPVCK